MLIQFKVEDQVKGISQMRPGTAATSATYKGGQT